MFLAAAPMRVMLKQVKRVRWNGPLGGTASSSSSAAAPTLSDWVPSGASLIWFIAMGVGLLGGLLGHVRPSWPTPLLLRVGIWPVCK